MLIGGQVKRDNNLKLAFLRLIRVGGMEEIFFEIRDHYSSSGSSVRDSRVIFLKYKEITEDYFASVVQDD